MKLLLLDEWVEVPDPVAYPGLVEVILTHAAVPGGGDKRTRPIRGLPLLLHVAKRGRRLARRAFSYAGSIGVTRTLAKVRSNLLAYGTRQCATACSFTGIVGKDSGALKKGTPVVGWLRDHPLWADRVLAHPEQFVVLPDGVDPAFAAMVLHAALARETCRRMGPGPGKAALLGDTLTGRYIKESLTRKGWEVRLCAHSTDLFDDGHGVDGEWSVLAREENPESLGAYHLHERFLVVGLNAENLDHARWTAVRDRWVGLPPSAEALLDPRCGMPLEIPDYLRGPALAAALTDAAEAGMQASDWGASVTVPEGVGGRLDLGVSCFIRAGRIADTPRSQVVRRPIPAADERVLRIGFVGLGMWARGNLIPFLIKDRRVRLVMAADFDPVRLAQGGRLFDIPVLATDASEVCRSPEIDAVFISTWHSSHGDIAAQALEAGKKVFVEKPPAINRDQLVRLQDIIKSRPEAFLAVGYNRVHAGPTPILRRAAEESSGPVTFTAIVREPSIPRTHYYYWPSQGTRIIGNSCHWIDYAFHLLLPRLPQDIQVTAIAGPSGQDNNVIIMRYGDGSLVSLTFTDRGESLIGGDELINLKVPGAEYLLEDFERLTLYKDGKRTRLWSGNADRGWEREMHQVVSAMHEGQPPRPHAELLYSARLVLAAVESYLVGGQTVTLDRKAGLDS